ncbi:MAG: succinylglutamate desuccinylase [Kangiellaceae bacterium]|nr:succinylglutamate desuccinylase [Kangiellaceae bacterium]MCW9000054.1 succinylglutamate desuccinylase [Kangiellaceae bacterium]
MLDFLEVSTGFIELSKQRKAPYSEEWTELPNKVKLRYRERGILEISPALPSNKDFVISCGVHGNETAPIEITSNLISQIVKGVVEPKVNLLFILGNPESMLIADRFVSINMNRLFNGAFKKYEKNEETRYELERAEQLEQYVTEFFSAREDGSKTHLDLHTAIKPSYHKTFAIRPYNTTSVTDDSRRLLVNLGIEAVLQHNKPSTTFSAFSVEQFQAEAYTLELGKVKPFGENKIEDFQKAINCLDILVQDRSLANLEIEELIEYKVVAEIIKHSEAFKFNVPDDVENFTPYPQGFLIAEDENYNYRVAFQEEGVVFPNRNVPVGQRVAVMVARKE